MGEERKRGLLATIAGREKLQQTKAAGRNEDGKPLTYQRIADKAVIDKKTVERFLKGTQPVDRDSACSICRALGLEITEIVDPNEWHRVESPKSSLQPATPSATLTVEPPPVNEWQGRQEEINELQTALSNDKVRLIGITAAGGYGKSALAVKFKEQLPPNWRVLWVSFIQPYPLAQFGRWLLEQLGRAYDEKWDEETLIGQIIAGLIAEPRLLVLDNMETVIPAEGKSVYGQFLSQWLGNGGNSKLLLTSREQPTLAPNLQPRCYWLPLEGLAEADAIRLVTENYSLTGTDAELAHFVNRMGRHPLLVQLVSSWMREELGKGVRVTEAENLGLDLFTVEGYHRDTETCVREVIAASLARLSARLGDILKRLSVLRGIFDLGLAQGLTAEVTDAELRYLARLSLLQEFPPEPLKGKRRRFEFLSLISMVVQRKASSELLQEAHRSALAYFSEHFPAPPWESLTDLTAYLEAFYHAGELGEWQLAFNLLVEGRGGEGKNKSVDSFLDLQGFYRQRADLYGRVVAGSQREQVCYRESLNRLGNCYDYLGRYEEALDHYRRSLAISEEINDRLGVANSLGNPGLCYHSLGRYGEAIDHHWLSLAISEEIGDRRGGANSLCGLGNCYFSLGRYEEAIDLYKQYHDLSEEIGERRGVAISLGNLGNCYFSLGRYEEAIDLYKQYHDLSEKIGFRQGVAISLGNLGLCYFSLGRYEEAIDLHRQHHDISEKIGDRRGVANSLGNLGLCYDSLGRYEEALEHHRQHHDISEKIGDRRGVANTLCNLGNCYLSLERYGEAIDHHRQHHDISEKIGDRRGVAKSLGNLGNCYGSLGRYEEALDHYRQYHDISEKIGDRQGMIIALHNIGYTRIKLENYSEAESKIQESLVISRKIGLLPAIAHSLKALAAIAHQTNQPQLAISHCQEAIALSQELGIPLVKDCEELLARIQENLGENQ